MTDNAIIVLAALGFLVVSGFLLFVGVMLHRLIKLISIVWELDSAGFARDAHDQIVTALHRIESRLEPADDDSASAHTNLAVLFELGKVSALMAEMNVTLADYRERSAATD